MMRKEYPSDISKKQFEIIKEDLKSVRKTTHTSTYDLYDIFCAVLYLLKEVYTWHTIPHDFPKWTTVRYHYDIWAEEDENGISLLDKTLHKLIKVELKENGREDKTTMIIVDSTFYENVDGIQNQTHRTKDLWKELDKLADQYGNIQQKDKARAEYILNELNSALGTEYSMTDNQINNYRTLSDEIDNSIAKKQAEMTLDSYLANSTEMTKQRIEARTDYENADKALSEWEEKLEDAERKFRNYRCGQGYDLEISVEDLEIFLTQK